jgi:hypothetical protein
MDHPDVVDNKHSRSKEETTMGSQLDLLDMKGAVVVSPPGLSGPEEKAITMLVEEVERRTHIRWETAAAWPSAEVPVIAVGPASALQDFAGRYSDALSGDEDARPPEGYRIRTETDGDAPAVLVVGNDARGVLFGVGHLLRTLRMGQGKVTLPNGLNVTTAPHYQLRGHQLGYRDKTNSYCGWGLEQWERYIRDMVVFGTNAIELIPPRSDDKPDSVHFIMPPLDMMEGMSGIAAEYDVDVWIWYPAMDEDYSDPDAVEFALKEWAQVFERLPRIDAVFVPGGDPGRTQPRHLMPMLEKQTASLQRFHPGAEMWISPQGFSDEWMDEFLGTLKGERPDWLTGVVFGPWIHMTTAEFRERIPAKYPIRNYPDITHMFSCEYPVPDWDVAYALTEGREIINPRPHDQAIIFRHVQSPTIGFLTYSEGCHDDVNKFIWSGLGWDPNADVVEILRQYSRYFIGERYTDDFAQGLLALERNWRGPLAENTGVYATLQQFQTLERAASPHDLKKWRFQQPLYRAYYDAYVRSRLLYESGLEEQAMAQLRRAPEKGSLLAMREAERVLDRAVNEPVSTGWRTRIFQLAEALFQSVHMQLSVDLYRGQSEVRGANLDGIDFPLNNGPWLKARFAEIRELAKEEDRLGALGEIVEWTNPGPGGFYDDLGSSCYRPHVVEGPGFEEDPGFWKTPFRRYPYWKNPRPLRLVWRGYVGALKDEPFEMRYTGLSPEARYKVRIVYSDLDSRVKVRLEAVDEKHPNDGVEVHSWIVKKYPPQPMEFDIPHEATRGGTLILRWHREPGRGGSGVGCEISEMWLIKV